MRIFSIPVLRTLVLVWYCLIVRGIQIESNNNSVSVPHKRTADVRFNQGANGGGPQTRCNDITYSPGKPEGKIWGVDCDALLDKTTDLHGLYMFQDWVFDGNYSMLWSYGTCNVGVYRSDGKNSYTQ